MLKFAQRLFTLQLCRVESAVNAQEAVYMSDTTTRMEILDQPESIRTTFQAEHEHIKEIARRIVDRGIERLYFVGMGSSLAAIYSAKCLLDRESTIPSDIFRGYELHYVNPAGLNEKSCMILVSLSGETEDVVAALRLAKEKRSLTVGITVLESTLAKEADEAIIVRTRDLKAMVAAYLTQLMTLYLLAGYITQFRDGSNKIEALIRDFERIPDILVKLINDERVRARNIARGYKNAKIFYVISAGPLYGLAYKLAMTMLTENSWVHGLVQYSCEFRHGIVEMIGKGLPIMFLLGYNGSEVDVKRELDTCNKIGAKTLVFDSAKYPKVDEFLTPFILAIPTEWFVYYLALERRKKPVARRYMGKVIPYAHMKGAKII